jgi:hypothetical protein
MRVVAAVVGATTTAANMCEACPAWRTCERWPATPSKTCNWTPHRGGVLCGRKLRRLCVALREKSAVHGPECTARDYFHLNTTIRPSSGTTVWFVVALRAATAQMTSITSVAVIGANQVSAKQNPSALPTPRHRPHKTGHARGEQN